MSEKQTEIIAFAVALCPVSLEEHRAGGGHFFPCPTCVSLRRHLRTAEAAGFKRGLEKSARLVCELCWGGHDYEPRYKAHMMRERETIEEVPCKAYKIRDAALSAEAEQ